jgi:hypothetical protein
MAAGLQLPGQENSSYSLFRTKLDIDFWLALVISFRATRTFKFKWGSLGRNHLKLKITRMLRDLQREE